MDWIHSTTLADCARIPAHAGPLALYVWTQSGGAPYDPQAPRWPVHLGTAPEVSRLLCVSVPTARRALSELRRWCHELRPGQWTPRLGVWTELDDGPTDRLGRPLYVRIDRRAVVRLVGLARGAHPQRARKAFQIAAMALPRLRSAAHGGRRSIALTNGQITGELATSRSTIAPAIALLEGAELLVQVGRGHRRISSSAGLLCEIPKVRRTGDQSSTEGVIRSVPPFIREQENPNAPHHRARTREEGADGGDRSLELIARELQAATWADGSPVLPDLGDRGAALLARHCESVADVEAWIEAEIMNLTDPDTANPAGLLVYLAREEGSRPRHSSSSERARRAKAEKNNRLGMDGSAHVRRFDQVFRGLSTHERLEAERLAAAPDAAEIEANRLEYEEIAAEASRRTEERRAAEICRFSHAPSPPVSPQPAAREANRSRLSALLSHLEESNI